MIWPLFFAVVSLTSMVVAVGAATQTFINLRRIRAERSGVDAGGKLFREASCVHCPVRRIP